MFVCILISTDGCVGYARLGGSDWRGSVGWLRVRSGEGAWAGGLGRVENWHEQKQPDPRGARVRLFLLVPLFLCCLKGQQPVNHVFK